MDGDAAEPLVPGALQTFSVGAVGDGLASDGVALLEPAHHVGFCFAEDLGEGWRGEKGKSEQVRNYHL